MPLKRLVPVTLYDQATTAHPYRFNGGGRAKAGEVRIDRRWRLVLDATCGPLTHRAGKDFGRLMRVTFGQPIKTGPPGSTPRIGVRVRDGAPDKPEGYRLQVTADQVIVNACDDEGGMRALFHLGRQMLDRRGPFLRQGRSTREPQWSLRITRPLLPGLWDTPGDFRRLPDSYLLNMARYGYNAVYLFADWFDYMRPDVAGPLARPGWRKRLADLVRAVEHLGGFGIRLLFHLNTPALPASHPQFKIAPTTRGAQTWAQGRHCLCSNSQQVLDLYEEAARQLFTDVPALAGAILITGGEAFLHCHSRPVPKRAGRTNCDRCFRRRPERTIAGAVNAVARGARAASPHAHILMWPYSAFSWGNLEQQKILLQQLDDGIGSLVAFEKDDWIKVAGTRSYVFDYSISTLGPSPRYRSLQRAARQRGLKTYAKTESSISIEMFNVPRIPVMHRWAQRFAALRSARPDGVHTSWRFYGFCAQRTDEIVDYFNWAQNPDIGKLLGTMARRDFGSAAAPSVVAAWRQFSRTFAQFPYSAGMTGFAYLRGPFVLGPAHPFIFDLTSPLGLSDRFWTPDLLMEEALRHKDKAHQTLQPRFFLDLTWTQPFGGRKAATRLAKMDHGWQQGMARLKRGLELARGPERKRLANETDLAQVVGSMFRTAHHLVQFQLLREQVTTRSCTVGQLRRACCGALEIIEAEIRNAQASLESVQRDPSLGFGPAYGPAFDADLIREKIDHSVYQVDQIIPRFYANYVFHMFGRMEDLSAKKLPKPRT